MAVGASSGSINQSYVILKALSFRKKWHLAAQTMKIRMESTLDGH
jgi:hypothetical protein